LLTLVDGQDCTSHNSSYVDSLYSNGVSWSDCASFTCCDYFQMGYKYDYYNFASSSELGNWEKFMNNVSSTCEKQFWILCVVV